MMSLKQWGWILGLVGSVAWAADTQVPLLKASVDVRDQAALQRGAGVYMTYCAPCHSLKYERYTGLAKGMGLVDDEGQVRDALIKSHLNWVSDSVHDAVQTASPAQDAEAWFGVAPPDLTLIARIRGADWLYSYLKGFYLDSKRPLGVNNLIFPDVGMPHVLGNLQGYLQPRPGVTVPHTWNDLEMGVHGRLTPAAYDQVISDLVTFLSYTAEPIKAERERLGVWILMFLVVFLVFAFLLKREYWKDVH